MQTRSKVQAAQPAHPALSATVERLLFEERTRWAMHVHDGLTQSVTSAVLELQTLRHHIEVDPEGAIDTLLEIERSIRNDLRDIRGVLFELHEEGSSHDGAPIAALTAALAGRWKLRARITTSGDLGSLGDATYEAAHGIIGEALANVAKHAGSDDVRIHLSVERGSLTIEVRDDGSGVTITPVTDHDQHFGIRMMRARAADAGGTFEMTSTPGHGTTVVAVLPVGGQGDTR